LLPLQKLKTAKYFRRWPKYAYKTKSNRKNQQIALTDRHEIWQDDEMTQIELEAYML